CCQRRRNVSAPKFIPLGSTALFDHVIHISGDSACDDHALAVEATEVVHPGRRGEAVVARPATSSPGAPDERPQECAPDPARSSLAGAACAPRRLASARRRPGGRPLPTTSVSLAGAASGGRRTCPA